MADDSGSRRPFGAVLNGQRWSRQPFRPRLKCPIQSQVADSDWVVHLGLLQMAVAHLRPAAIWAFTA